MPKFKDNEGREYTLSLNYGKAVTIEDELGVPILSKPEDADYGIRNCVSMAYVICEDQIQSYGLSPTDFGSAFDADVLGDLCVAVVESVVLFIRGQNPQAAIQLQMSRYLAGGISEIMLENLASLQESGFFESPDSWESILTGEVGGSSEKCFMDAFQRVLGEVNKQEEKSLSELQSMLIQSLSSKQ